MLERSLPNHFDELCLIDCKMTPTLIENLMESLLGRSRLRKFALVKAQHSTQSFDAVIKYVS